MLRPIFQKLLLAALVALLAIAPARAADRLRLGLQKTGSGVWELAVVSAFGLDKEAGLELAVTELANTDAAKIAIQSGSVDIVVSDWLWVARQRSEGAKLTFYPHSTAIGALMARDKAVKSVADLSGKKLGVAGGPLDKSWLLLRAYAKRQGVDLEKTATIVYGAPPLIAEKAAEGELDAALEFWNFAADLEARGLSRVIDLRKVETALGAKGAPVVTGYVFDEGFAANNAAPLARFFAMIDKARHLIAASDAAWRVALQRIPAKDTAVLALYRKSYVEGIPARSVAEEREDAAGLYATLAEIGGAALVGSAKTLPAGTFYEPAASALR
ncbi:ABC transporter substrate-binding protein [Methylosinus sp. C49]|uniref:ABC transporter substrate-binding protein n=1 Tax=Methylosinus sp. C49 TaxID=2699395 RepID=UPI00157769A8|nr:ABC transporter substrate-binding protein [Methylosinus sp. C49]